MTPVEIGQLVANLVGGSAGLGALLFLILQKRIRTPADENESVKLGNEFLRGLLSDARAEREELRKTIDELRDERTTHVASIARLEALLSSKDDRIQMLEQLLQDLTEKLQRGEPITLEDILGVRTSQEAAA